MFTGYWAHSYQFQVKKTSKRTGKHEQKESLRKINIPQTFKDIKHFIQLF